MTKMIGLSAAYIAARADEVAADRALDALRKARKSLDFARSDKSLTPRTASLLHGLDAELERLQTVATELAWDSHCALGDAASAELSSVIAGHGVWEGESYDGPWGAEDIEPSEYDVRGSEEVES